MTALAVRARTGLWAIRDQLAARARREDGGMDATTIIVGIAAAATLLGIIAIGVNALWDSANTAGQNGISKVTTQQ